MSSVRVSTASPSTACGTASWPSWWPLAANVREVSEWAGHNSVAFTLTHYGGLFEDGSNQAVDRLDALILGVQTVAPVAKLRRD